MCSLLAGEHVLHKSQKRDDPSRMAFEQCNLTLMVMKENIPRGNHMQWEGSDKAFLTVSARSASEPCTVLGNDLGKAPFSCPMRGIAGE
jgi:hypothetical protein